MNSILAISTTHFTEFKKLIPRSGENRLQFFKRQFKRFFKKDMKKINQFIVEYGYQPMLPDWIRQKGCYAVSAFKYFFDHPNRNQIVSALMFADLLYKHPKVEIDIIERVNLIDQLSQLQPYANELGLSLASEFLDEQIYIKKGGE